MEAEFQITKEEYVTAGLLNGMMSQQAKYIHYAIDILLIVLGLVSLYSENVVWAGGFIGAAIGGNLIPYALRSIYIPWYLNRHYKKYNLVKKPVVVSLHEEGVKFTATDSEFLLKWSEMHRWRENSSLILIYIAPKIYYILPKRIQELGFPVKRLRERLVNHFGAST